MVYLWIMAPALLNIMLKITKIKHFIWHLKRAVVVNYSDNALYIGPRSLRMLSDHISHFKEWGRSRITFYKDWKLVDHYLAGCDYHISGVNVLFSSAARMAKTITLPACSSWFLPMYTPHTALLSITIEFWRIVCADWHIYCTLLYFCLHYSWCMK